MKNKLVAKVLGNKFLSTVLGEFGRFYIEHESAILTTGTIGFGWAAVALAMKNATKIHYILEDYKAASLNCNTKEERNRLCVVTLKAILPLAAPIIIFEGLATAFAISSKKRTDKIEFKLAETAGALSITQAALTQYQNFAKDAEEALGEERVHEIQKEIDEKTVYEASSSPVNTKQSDGDKLVYEPITGQLFWSTPDRINLAWEKYKTEVMTSEKHFVPVSEVFFDRMGVDSRTMSAEVFGYYNEDAAHMSDKIYLDSTTVMVNGEETAVLKMNYYPAVRLVTDEVFD